MDMVITVVGWIIGLYVAFMLILAIGFSAGGAANTKNSDLSIMSLASTFLLIYLIYKGFSFLFGPDESDAVARNVPPVTQAVQYDSTEIDVSTAAAPTLKAGTASPKRETRAQVHEQSTVKKEKERPEYLLWFLYTFAFVYAIWLFKPSKDGHKEKELAKKKIMATMMFKKDATGLQAWHPAWKPDDQL